MVLHPSIKYFEQNKRFDRRSSKLQDRLFENMSTSANQLWVYEVDANDLILSYYHEMIRKNPIIYEIYRINGSSRVQKTV